MEEVRLPWYQIDEEAILRGEMLGQMLGISPERGVGMTVKLWRWALVRSEPGDFQGDVPDGESVAAALGWPPADAARLIQELVRVGLLAVQPSLRVRGLDRYRACWLKNRRKGHKNDNRA